MDTPDEEFMNYLKDQSQDENSYEEQLEQQKIVLLAQKEKESWKRLLYETERYRDQYLREDRLELKQLSNIRKFIYTLNEPRFKSVIDQSLERWLNDDNGSRNGYEAEISELRSRIDRMKLQAARYKEVFEKVQESRSHQMAQESLLEVREEEIKLETSQKKIDYLWKTSDEQARNEWNEMKLMIVEFSKLGVDSIILETEKDAIVQNNNIKKTKIIQLHEEIEQAKVEQEEDLKRREIELNERMLIPIKITPMTLENSIFKNPNDFPALINKIESTRKSYEQIFKRPEYMENKSRKHKSLRSKHTAQYSLLYSKSKSNTQPRNAKSKKAEAAKCGNLKLNNSEKTRLMKILYSKLKHYDTQEKSPTEESTETNKRNKLDEIVDEIHRPICNVQAQQIKRQSCQSISQPELLDTSEPPKKRPSMEVPVSASAPAYTGDRRESKKPQQDKQYSGEKSNSKLHSKSKKVSFMSEESTHDMERNVSTYPVTSDRSISTTSQPQEPPRNCSTAPSQQQQQSNQLSENTMDFEPQEQPQQAHDDDNFSFGSASPPINSHKSKDDGGSFFDTGSISSFDMDDRESNSDLGFDLSPVAPKTNGNGERSGNESDFDFLASPPRSTAQLGTQDGNKKGQDCFAFTDTDDSGAAFDFF